MDIRQAVSQVRSQIGETAWERLKNRLSELGVSIATRGIRSLRDRYDVMTGYAYGEVYDWDTYFESIFASYFGLYRYCRNNVEAFLDRQKSSGFTSRTLGVVHKRPNQHCKPFLAQTALLYCKQRADVLWLEGKCYERLRKYLEYWFWYLDFDKNGLPVWESADHSGMDNQYSRTGQRNTMAVEGVDLACYLVRELRAMSLLADTLRRTADADAFRDQADALGRKMDDVFWDREDGFYYDRNERTGEAIKVKSIAGLLPLWAGVASPDRANQLVKRHLLAPEEFWTRYPVATYARTESDYQQERGVERCNWRGSVWIPANYMIFHGLRRCNFMEQARAIAYSTLELVLSEDRTREYYNGETGAGQGLNPFWGWSSLGYVMPLEFELGYDPTDPGQDLVANLGTTAFGVRFPPGVADADVPTGRIP